MVSLAIIEMFAVNIMANERLKSAAVKRWSKCVQSTLGSLMFPIIGTPSTRIVDIKKNSVKIVMGDFGFVCTSTITHKCMLHGDHIDGNPSNNDESNIQTLCLCCHAFKTITNKDYLTPGRKTLGVTC